MFAYADDTWKLFVCAELFSWFVRGAAIYGVLIQDLIIGNYANSPQAKLIARVGGGVWVRLAVRGGGWEGRGGV